MDYFINPQILEFLWTALNHGKGQRQQIRTHYYFKKFLKAKWAFKADIEDVLDYSDSRLNPNHMEITELVKAFGMNWQLVCLRPKARSIFVSEYDAIRIEDVAYLLMILERIGFGVDPSF